MFSFSDEGLREGKWYKFDINKFKGKTKLNPDYIVAFRLQEFILNFCITQDEGENYFCISNIIAFKNDNPRTENQDLLDIDRIMELNPDGEILNCTCHNKLYMTKLKNKRMISHEFVNERKHNELIDKKCFVNTIKIENNKYDVVYLNIDTNTEKLIRRKE